MAHQGKCANYHGHRYTALITVSNSKLYEGMVMDFGDIKRLLGAWIDENWDHGMLLQAGDPMIPMLEFGGCKHWVMMGPPTAEEMAKELYAKAVELLPDSIFVERVRLYETPNCHADYEHEDSQD